MLAPGGAGEHDVGVSGRLRHEDVLADDELAVLQGLLHVGGVGLGLQRVLAEVVERVDLAFLHAVRQVGQLEAGLEGQLVLANAPRLGELCAVLGILNALVARIQVRPHAHVAAALNVVLAADGGKAGVVAADLVGDAGDGSDLVDGLDALALLRDAHAPADNGVLGSGVHAHCLAERLRVDARDVLDGFRRVLLDNLPPLVVTGGVGLDERAVFQALVDDDVGERVHERKVAAVLDRHVDVGDARGLDEARVGDDDLGALLFRLDDAAGDDRVRGARVVAEQEDAVRVLHVRDGHAHGAGTDGVDQADDRRAVARARAVVDVVGAHAGAGELLHHEVRLVAGAAGRARQHDGIRAVLGLDLHEALRCEVKSFVPAHALELGTLMTTDHRVKDARRQDLGVVDEIVAAHALEAKLALVRHAVQALGADDPTVLNQEVELAASSAVRTYSHMLFHGIPPL